MMDRECIASGKEVEWFLVDSLIERRHALFESGMLKERCTR